jgi:hypothetical protein
MFLIPVRERPAGRSGAVAAKLKKIKKTEGEGPLWPKLGTQILF